MPDPFFQYNNAGAAILADAGIRLNQLSPGSYGMMMGALEYGDDFSFRENSDGLFDVVTKPKGFWENIINGSSTDNFLGSLFGGGKQDQSGVAKETSQKSFWNFLGKTAANIAGLGPIAGIAASIPAAATETVETKQQEMTRYAIRIGLFLVGLVLIAIGVVFLLKDSASDIVGGTIKKAIKG